MNAENLSKIKCPECSSENKTVHTTYTVASGEQRKIYCCADCGNYFSETNKTPIARLRTPLSLIIFVIKAVNEGMSINAAARLFGVTKKSVTRWLERLSDLKATLLLYALCHQFLQSIVEGDELYTKVGENKPASESEGWTIVLMERATRFIWVLACGQKDEELFKAAIDILAQVIEQTADLSLVTDGERRYGNLLFEICQEVIRDGRVGRPPTTLKKGVKVRLKNKGSQSRKKGGKRPKYQAPHREHPETEQNLDHKEVHANHLEGFNAALRRRLSCFRRKSNTYAKNITNLQIRLDVQWILHNFANDHFTTQKVPAVALGILDEGLTLEKLFIIQSI